MARFRRGASIRPVNRIKHVIDSQATLAKATALKVVIIATTDTPVISGTNNVQTGATVNGFYLKVEVASNETEVVGAVPNVYMMVWKDPGGNLTPPSANAVGGNDNKRYVFHQEMIMLENSKGGNPRVLFNGVIAIPKHFRRCAPDDDIVVTLLSPSVDIAICVQCHYKEFR